MFQITWFIPSPGGGRAYGILYDCKNEQKLLECEKIIYQPLRYFINTELQGTLKVFEMFGLKVDGKVIQKQGYICITR